MENENIKGIIEEILNKMCISFDEIEIQKDDSGNPKFLIKTAESGLLIGSKGEHFLALSHIVKRMVWKNTKDEIRFSLDINNYQEENLRSLKSKAMSLAEKVKSSKGSLEMDPMSPYERMIIHALFSSDPNITTESIGENKDRRIVLKYNPI
jgi:spoIIIJ-associated protein